MSVLRTITLIVAASLVAVYGYRAVIGVRAGLAQAYGHYELNSGRYTAASRRLERADVGLVRLRALRMLAEARLSRWDRQVEAFGSVAAERENLKVAGERYLEGLCAAPASREALQGLGRVYDRAEWVHREARADGPLAPVDSQWERIGRSGRISIGMMRRALERAPEWFRLHDALAITLWSYGLEDKARERVRTSAQALPMYFQHSYRFYDLPPWVLTEFSDSSRAAVGTTPLFPLTMHLLDLGKLERRIGRHDAAVETLREALAARGDALNQAEAQYHLGLSLMELGQTDEGRQMLDLAAGHPVFRVPAITSLAGFAERRGELETALQYLRQLRWEQPADADHCLRFARVARELEDWPAALEALRVARQARPDEPAPWIATIEVYVEMGDTASAISTLDLIREWPSIAEEAEQMELWIRGQF